MGGMSEPTGPASFGRVDPDGTVRLFLASEDFTLPSIPESLEEYLAYCERTIGFVTARNKRIQQLGL